MIIITQPLWDPWPEPDPVNLVNETITVIEDKNIRTSAILGPDGEPLRIVRARPQIGFDLRPRHARDA